MLDSIFVQSFDAEIRNGKLFAFLSDLIVKKLTNIEIYVFLNFKSLEHRSEIVNSPFFSNIKFVFINDELVKNPTTKMFHFIMNYKVKCYKQVLLLESDCILMSGFDVSINNELCRCSQKEWAIFGSTYYGNKWDHVVSEQRNENAFHFNGVAVYNRTSEFLQKINGIFIKNKFEQTLTNYDFALYKETQSDKTFQNQCIDSSLILNLSDYSDIGMTHTSIKPYSVVIHTKNSNYKLTDNLNQLIEANVNCSDGDRQVPVFLHIPKCGGTYIRNCLHASMVWYGARGEWHKSSRWNLSACCLDIFYKGACIVSLLVNDFSNIKVNFKEFKQLTDHSYSIDLMDFLKCMNNINVFIFSILINSSGVNLSLMPIVDVICGNFKLKPMFFSCLRKPLDKAFSMFNYLTSEKSKHEPTYLAFTSLAFSKFIQTYEVEDCWLIRKLLQLPDSSCITEAMFEQTANFNKIFNKRHKFNK